MPGFSTVAANTRTRDERRIQLDAKSNVCGRQPRAPRLAIGFVLDWVLLLVVVSLPLVHYRIILREERYQERKFGDEYRRYKTKIPRYWWRF